MWASPRFFAALLLTLALAAPRASAQGLRGTLVDEGTERPVAGATVRLLVEGGGNTRTDAAGAWRLDVPPGAAMVRVRAEKPGFATVETLPFDPAAASGPLALRTHAEVPVLAGVSVPAMNHAGVLSRDERRMGMILDPDEVRRRMQRIAPDDVGEFVGALVPGLEVTPEGMPLLPRSAGGPGCNPTIVVDGRRFDPPRISNSGPVRPPWDINELVALEEIRAVEVYGDATRVPGELGLAFLEPIRRPCGVIVVWTRVGLGVD